jgi:hypothetical protein
MHAERPLYAFTHLLLLPVVPVCLRRLRWRCCWLYWPSADAIP